MLSWCHGAGGVGYLLKDRVSALSDLADALERVASGGTVLDPEVVAQTQFQIFPVDQQRDIGIDL